MHVGGEEVVVPAAQEPMANDPIVAVLVVASLPLAAPLVVLTRQIQSSRC